MDLFCSSLGLHSLALPKIGGASEEKINGFILFFAQFVLYLQLRNHRFGNRYFGTKIEAYEIF